MSDPSPADVALTDQLQAEVMQAAREFARANGAALSDDLESGMVVGFAATLAVLERNGWLSRP